MTQVSVCAHVRNDSCRKSGEKRPYVCHMGRHALLVLLAAASAMTLSRSAQADPVRLHVGGGLAHAVGAPQQTQFGFGGAGAVSVEIPVAGPFGVQAEVSTIVLSAGSNDDPSLVAKGTGIGIGAMLGVRVRPFSAKPGGLWLDANGGLAPTGNVARPGFDAHVGWDFRVGKGRFDLGPYVGYTHIFQLGEGPRPEDAHILAFGIEVGLGAPPPKPPPRTDRDKDTVYDDEDACPDVTGRRTTDPKTNGCPRTDRDGDAVYDDEDACPTVPGRRTTDPKTNGCPRTDRDGDAVYDDEDACPDTPGVRTTDPKTNGCPAADRDADGIPDVEDACPDVVGVPTNDPKTNGCPPAAGSVRVAGDEIELDEVILFGTDSPRVRHESWPIVKKVAELLLANPDIEEVDIEGHADERGTEQHNLMLSRSRAQSVKRLLVKFGVADSRIKTHGYGDKKPRATGRTVQALRKNRRVEFQITKTQSLSMPKEDR